MRSGVGLVASSHYVETGPVDVLSEPFNSLSAWSIVSGTPVWVDGVTGPGVSVSGGLNGIAYTIPGANESDYLTFGVAFKVSAFSASPSFIELRADAGGTQHNRIGVGSTGTLFLTRGPSTVIATTASSGLIVADTWYYLEVQIRLHDTAGSVIMNLNGTEVLNATSLDTRVAGTDAVYDTLRLLSGAVTATYDNFYLTTGAGAAFKGVQTIGPDYAALNASATEAGTSMGAQSITAAAGIAAGDLLLAFAAHDNSGTALTASAGWTTIRETANAAVVRLGVFARIADLSGSDALTITGSANDYCASMLCIKGHGVSASTIATDIRSAITDSASGSANPPSLDAGASGDWLWLAAAAVDLTSGETITAMPSGYTQAHAALASASSTSSCALGVAFKVATAQTENPGTFTHNTQEWATCTLAIPKTTVPAAPVLTGATPGNTEVALAWTAPANGGSAITDYVVEYRTTAGPGSWTVFSEGTSTTAAATVTGLTNGTGYDFRVSAVNAIGTSAVSNTMSATPTSAVALALTMGAFGAGNYVGGAQPPGSLDLPDWAVTAGELLVVGVGGCSSNAIHGNPYWLLSGGGLTWTRWTEARRSSGEYLSTAAIFYAIASSTTTITDMTVTTSTNALDICYALAKAVGYNATTPMGAKIAVADDSNDGAKNATLDATPASTSILWGVIFVNANDNVSGKAITHGSSEGWTEDFDYSGSMNVSNAYGSWEGQRKVSTTSTSVRWDDLSSGVTTAYTCALCAVEIKAA